MKRCYWKDVSESFSKEGELMKMQNSYINFNKCKKKCDGYNLNCEFYEIRELQPVEEEIIEDSSGRLEDIEDGGGWKGMHPVDFEL